MTTRVRQSLLALGATSSILGILPWLGLGDFNFAVPGWEVRPPRLDLLRSHFLLYDVLCIPLELLACIPPLDDFIHFQSEGRSTVRPFAFSVIYLLIGGVNIWMACRRGPGSAATPGLHAAGPSH